MYMLLGKGTQLSSDTQNGFLPEKKNLIQNIYKMRELT